MTVTKKLTEHHNITPVILEGLGRGEPNSTATLRQLCSKSYVIEGEAIAINQAQIQTP